MLGNKSMDKKIYKSSLLFYVLMGDMFKSMDNCVNRKVKKKLIIDFKSIMFGGRQSITKESWGSYTESQKFLPSWDNVAVITLLDPGHLPPVPNNALKLAWSNLK